MKTIFFLFILCLVPYWCGATEFTVDDRSALHVGASALISSSCTAMTYDAQSESTRNAVCISVALAIGSVKESGLDASPDMGDMAFNALGAVLGVYVTDKIFIWARNDTIGVGGTF
jgi:hypothetical protein